MKTLKDCTHQEFSDYNTAQQDAIDSHTRSIAKLKVRKKVSNVKQDEIDTIKDKIADLKADRAILRARREAFYARRAQIEPPSPDQLGQLKNNLDKVDKLTVERSIIVEITRLTTDAFNTFNEIQPAS